MDEEMVMYILVNKELDMHKGKMAAQVGHAVGLYVDKVYRENYKRDDYEKWMSTNVTKIVLKCSDKNMQEIIRDNPSIVHIIDAGKTQIDPGSLTVICLGIGTKTKMVKLFPLIKYLHLM